MHTPQLFGFCICCFRLKRKKLHVHASSIFCSQTNGNVQHMNSNEKKKKNFSFSKRFPFMKSKDHAVGEDISADERK